MATSSYPTTWKRKNPLSVPPRKDLTKNVGKPNIYNVSPDCPEDKLDGTKISLGYEHTSGVERESEGSVCGEIKQTHDLRKRLGEAFFVRSLLSDDIRRVTETREKAVAELKAYTVWKKQTLNQWFTDLGRGDPLSKLAQRVPYYNKKSLLIEALLEHMIPVARADWFIKITIKYEKNDTTSNRKAFPGPTQSTNANTAKTDPVLDWTKALLSCMHQQLSVLADDAINSAQEQPYGKHLPKPAHRTEEQQCAQVRLKYILDILYTHYAQSILHHGTVISWVLSGIETAKNWKRVSLLSDILLQLLTDVVNTNDYVRRCIQVSVKKLTQLKCFKKTDTALTPTHISSFTSTQTDKSITPDNGEGRIAHSNKRSHPQPHRLTPPPNLSLWELKCYTSLCAALHTCVVAAPDALPHLTVTVRKADLYAHTAKPLTPVSITPSPPLNNNLSSDSSDLVCVPVRDVLGIGYVQSLPSSLPECERDEIARHLYAHVGLVGERSKEGSIFGSHLIMHSTDSMSGCGEVPSVDGTNDSITPAVLPQSYMVLDALDSFNIPRKVRSIAVLYATIFRQFHQTKPNQVQVKTGSTLKTSNENNINLDVLQSIRFIIEWAITSTRPGSHRVYVAVRLLTMWSEQENENSTINLSSDKLGDGRFTSNSKKIVHQALLSFIETYETESSYRSRWAKQKENNSLVWLYSELVIAGLFNYDSFVRSLIYSGALDKKTGAGKGKSAESSAKAHPKGDSTNTGILEKSNVHTDPPNAQHSRSAEVSITSTHNKPHAQTPTTTPTLKSTHGHISSKKRKDSINTLLLRSLPIANDHLRRHNFNQRRVLLYGAQTHPLVEVNLRNRAGQVVYWLEQCLNKFTTKDSTSDLLLMRPLPGIYEEYARDGLVCQGKGEEMSVLAHRMEWLYGQVCTFPFLYQQDITEWVMKCVYSYTASVDTVTLLSPDQLAIISRFLCFGQRSILSLDLIRWIAQHIHPKHTSPPLMMALVHVCYRHWVEFTTSDETILTVIRSLLRWVSGRKVFTGHHRVIAILLSTLYDYRDSAQLKELLLAQGDTETLTAYTASIQELYKGLRFYTYKTNQIPQPGGAQSSQSFARDIKLSSSNDYIGPGQREITQILTKMKEGTDTHQQFLSTLLDKCLVENPSPKCIGVWAHVCAAANETSFLNVPFLRWARSKLDDASTINAHNADNNPARVWQMCVCLCASGCLLLSEVMDVYVSPLLEQCTQSFVGHVDKESQAATIMRAIHLVEALLTDVVFDAEKAKQLDAMGMSPCERLCLSSQCRSLSFDTIMNVMVKLHTLHTTLRASVPQYTDNSETKRQWQWLLGLVSMVKTSIKHISQMEYVRVTSLRASDEMAGTGYIAAVRQKFNMMTHDVRSVLEYLLSPLKTKSDDKDHNSTEFIADVEEDHHVRLNKQVERVFLTLSKWTFRRAKLELQLLTAESAELQSTSGIVVDIDLLIVRWLFAKLLILSKEICLKARTVGYSDLNTTFSLCLTEQVQRRAVVEAARILATECWWTLTFNEQFQKHLNANSTNLSNTDIGDVRTPTASMSLVSTPTATFNVPIVKGGGPSIDLMEKDAIRCGRLLQAHIARLIVPVIHRMSASSGDESWCDGFVAKLHQQFKDFIKSDTAPAMWTTLSPSASDSARNDSLAHVNIDGRRGDSGHTHSQSHAHAHTRTSTNATTDTHTPRRVSSHFHIHTGLLLRLQILSILMKHAVKKGCNAWLVTLLRLLNVYVVAMGTPRDPIALFIIDLLGAMITAWTADQNKSGESKKRLYLLAKLEEEVVPQLPGIACQSICARLFPKPNSQSTAQKTVPVLYFTSEGPSSTGGAIGTVGALHTHNTRMGEHLTNSNLRQFPESKPEEQVPQVSLASPWDLNTDQSGDHNGSKLNWAWFKAKQKGKAMPSVYQRQYYYAQHHKHAFRTKCPTKPKDGGAPHPITPVIVTIHHEPHADALSTDNKLANNLSTQPSQATTLASNFKLGASSSSVAKGVKRPQPRGTDDAVNHKIPRH
eukprot:CFRG7694T1